MWGRDGPQGALVHRVQVPHVDEHHREQRPVFPMGAMTNFFPKLFPHSTFKHYIKGACTYDVCTGGLLKSDAGKALGKGGCVKMQTRGGSKNPKILQTS